MLIDRHIENSKNDKKVILATITSPKCQCAVDYYRLFIIFAVKLQFVLLARYVPNVAKRSILDQCKKSILTTDRPTDRPATDRRPATSDRQPTNDLTLESFKWPHLCEGSCDPLHVWFYCIVFGVGGSNGANTGKPHDAASVTRSKFKV